jgi:Mn2+/Fe2+ NRAMP family transporter
MLLTFPLMAGIQEISARVGRTTGRGIAGNLCRHYPAWLLYAIVSLVFVANAINIGADLSAMGDAIHLLIGGPELVYVVLLSILCTALIVFMSYERYALILKWLTLSLFAYVAALFAVQINQLGRGVARTGRTENHLVQRFLHDVACNIRHHHLSLFVFLASLAGSRGTAH